MSRRKDELNTEYLGIGNVPLPPVLIARMRALAEHASLAAVVRAALLATYAPDLIPEEMKKLATMEADKKPKKAKQNFGPDCF